MEIITPQKKSSFHDGMFSVISSQERNILLADCKNLSVDFAVLTDKPHSYKQVFY